MDRRVRPSPDSSDHSERRSGVQKGRGFGGQCPTFRRSLVKHDLIVIGDGPAAWFAAGEGLRLGLDVLLIRPEIPGSGAGNTVHAIPPRLRQAFASRIVATSQAYGLVDRTDGWKKHSWKRVLRWTEQSVRAYMDSLQQRSLARGLRTKTGTPWLDGPHAVRFGSTGTVSATNVLIATGTRPRRPRRFAFDDVVICDPVSCFYTVRRLRAVTVIGADDEGCELASLFATVGAAVTLVDRRNRLMRAVDRDVLDILHHQLQQGGVDVVLGEEIGPVVRESDRGEPHALVELESGRVEPCDRVVVCAGRAPNVDRLGLEEVGVARDFHGFLTVNEFGQTSQAGILAAGDVTGVDGELGIHLAQARVVVHAAAGLDPPWQEHVPRSIHTIPEVASVGLTEEACAHLGLSPLVGRAPFSPVVLGMEGRRAPGLLKLVADGPQGRLVGVHLIGLHATDVLPLGIGLLREGATMKQIATMAFNAPGLCEVYGAAAWDGLLRGARAP